MKTKLEEALDLVDELDKAAQSWGWEADQGFGSSVDRANSRHSRALSALENFLKENLK